MKWKNKGHELDYIGKSFADKKKIYIYGAGQEIFGLCRRIYRCKRG